MCLAIPGQIVTIDDQGDTKMGTVDFDGIHKDVCLAFLPEADVGDYVLVHVGFAITNVDYEAAIETLALLRASGALQSEIGTPDERTVRP